MYFDAALDEHLNPLCNGTPEEVKAWLNGACSSCRSSVYRVCVGQSLSLLTVEEYLRGAQDENTDRN